MVGPREFAEWVGRVAPAVLLVDEGAGWWRPGSPNGTKRRVVLVVVVVVVGSRPTSESEQRRRGSRKNVSVEFDGFSSFSNGFRVVFDRC